MGKISPQLNNSKSRLGQLQLLPYTLLGTILFVGVSSAHLNQFVSAYLVLLAAQLGTVGIYLFMSWWKSKHRQDRSPTDVYPWSK